MSDERFTDEEVRADFFKREDSERDQTRNREMRPAFAGGSVVAHWLCRGGCGTLCEVTEDACEGMVVFNRRLRALGEQPLDTTRIVFCADCRKVDEARYQARAASARGEISWRIRELRENNPGPQREAVLVHELRGLGCDDIGAILHAIKEKRSAGGRPRSRDVLA